MNFLKCRCFCQYASNLSAAILASPIESHLNLKFNFSPLQKTTIMIIYMRHGNDEQDHPKFENDPSIRSDTYHIIIKHYNKLVNKYGEPDIVYVSPMRRCIKTATIMGFEEIYVNPGLSRYFKADEVILDTIDPRTQNLDVPLHETSKEFKTRARDTINDIHKYIESGKYVWVITHSLILKQAAKFYGTKLNKHHDFLEWFSIIQN